MILPRLDLEVAEWPAKKHKSGKELAEESVEIGKKVSRTYGFQDYYASSHGGLNLIEFGKDGETSVNPIIIPSSLKKSLSQKLNAS